MKIQIVDPRVKPYDYSEYRCPQCKTILNYEMLSRLTDSLWGEVRTRKAIGDNYCIVETKAHVGHMIHHSIAQNFLPERTLGYSKLQNNYYCFTDDSWRLLVWELKKHLLEIECFQPSLASYLKTKHNSKLFPQIKNDFPEYPIDN